MIEGGLIHVWSGRIRAGRGTASRWRPARRDGGQRDGLASRHQIGLDLLERIPEEQVTHRAALEQLIAQHVDDLVAAIEKGRQRQQRIGYFTENWRDLVLFLTTVLFTVVTWHADHHRPVWLPLFIAATLITGPVMILFYVLTGLLAPKQ